MSDIESVGDPEIENDLELILEGDQASGNEEQTEEVTAENDNEENAEGDSRKVVKPKRVIRNPQPKLNEQTLQGPRGLSAIEGYFERVNFKGKGHEKEDLNVILKTYEYWCHRLFPKFPFDSCIERLEKLGTKRATLTQIKKIRMGLDFDEPENVAVSDEEVNETSGFVDTYNDQFDQLVSTVEKEPEPVVTEEQLQRIRENMEKAKRLREEKLRKTQEMSQNEPMEVQSIVSSEVDSASCISPQNSIGNISEDPQCNDMETDDKGIGNEVDDDEDDIENILKFINADDESPNVISKDLDKE